MTAFGKRLAARVALQRYIRRKRRTLFGSTPLRGVERITGLTELQLAEILQAAYRRRNRSVLSGFLFPAEMVHCYGIAPVFTETLGAIIAGSPFATPALEVAEALGYSRDGCSFHRATLGAGLGGFLPKFNLIIATSHLCDGQNKSLEALSDALNIPYYLLDVPQENTPTRPAS